MVDLAVIRSRHPSFYSHSDRFPFWALNTKLRAQAQAQGRVFMHKYIGANNLTMVDINEKLNSDNKPVFLKYTAGKKVVVDFVWDFVWQLAKILLKILKFSALKKI